MNFKVWKKDGRQTSWENVASAIGKVAAVLLAVVLTEATPDEIAALIGQLEGGATGLKVALATIWAACETIREIRQRNRAAEDQRAAWRDHQTSIARVRQSAAEGELADKAAGL